MGVAAVGCGVGLGLGAAPVGAAVGVGRAAVVGCGVAVGAAVGAGRVAVVGCGVAVGAAGAVRARMSRQIPETRALIESEPPCKSGFGACYRHQSVRKPRKRARGRTPKRAYASARESPWIGSVAGLI